MKSFSLLAVGLLSTAVATDPNGNHHKHRKHNISECTQLLASEHLLAKANNPTLMQRYQSNYPNMAAMIKSKTQDANSRKTAIEGKHPVDWLSKCHIEGAHRELRRQCFERDVLLPKKLKKWNDPKKGPKIQKQFEWSKEQFAQEKDVIESKINDLKNNGTLSELCVTLPKDPKGGKGDKGPDGKEGAKPDGKGDKGKGADGKPAGE
jgi:hypothetical protein